MRVLIYGATGMVGQGVLNECLRDENVSEVVTVGRSATGRDAPKLRELAAPDFANLEAELKGFDACFFCLGISSFRTPEDAYTKITYDLTLRVAGTLARLNPSMTFIYVSGEGADGSESPKSAMWQRVRGRTENAILALPFKGYVFRPGMIQALDGIQSRTAIYKLLFPVMMPLLPLLKFCFPNAVTTTREVGQAMLAVARKGYAGRVLRTVDFKELTAGN